MRIPSIFARSIMTVLVFSATTAVAGQSGHHHGQKPLAHEMGHGGQKFYMFNGPTSPSADYARERFHFEPPPVTLRDHNGVAVDLKALLAEPRPVVLQFIFTSCATICPVLSAGLAQSNADLTRLAPDTRLISISIDPEYDTPQRLGAYAARYRAGDNWTFLTGSLADIRKVIVAYNALYENDNKMYHLPYTYLRSGPEQDWVRLEGLLSRANLVREYAGLLGPAPTQATGVR